MISTTAQSFQQTALADLSSLDQQLFEQFGSGPQVPLTNKLIHQFIEERVALDPKAIAIEYQGQSITYKELNEQAKFLAYKLIAKGVRPGDKVCLFVERSIAMVVGLFAILKAGGTYVPQDARIAPTAQLGHITKITKAPVILTLSHLKHRVPLTKNIICLNIDEIIVNEFKVVTSPLNVTLPNNSSEAFILFTSGTTGMPNGVKVTHRNLENIIRTSPGNLNIKPGMKVSQILNISFDMCAWEILSALTNGATLVIRGKDIQKTVSQVDVVIATPSVLASLDINKCKNIKVAAVAGEPCPISLAQDWSQFCQFNNSCGPTETTIVNTLQNFNESSGRLTIGQPTPNNTVYILDENLKPCKIGDIGEMWAGGACVTAGYLGNEKLTAERYKRDPFLGGNNKMFRTRDLGRWTKKGELEHFGRTDDQVKIRGFRIELDSVSNAIESVPGCKQAVTLKLDDQNLVSFITPRGLDIKKINKSLETLLPYYCAPKQIIQLDELPKTNRGKIDKKALTVLAVKVQEQLKKSQEKIKPLKVLVAEA